jgi:C4-type Zn-finger protein
MKIQDIPQNKKIKCDKCGSILSIEDLKKDYHPFYSETIWSNCVCPNCGKWLGLETDIDEKFLVDDR